MGVKLYLVLALAGPLVACAASPDASPQQLSKDLIAAEASKCQNMGSQFRRVECFDSIERPIWAVEAPDTLDLYSRWDAERDVIATRYDNRTLSAENTNAAFAAGNAELWRQVAQRQHYKEQQSAERAEGVSNFLGTLMLLGTAFMSGYNHGAGYDQPPAPVVMTTCTQNGTITNCLSQ